MWPVRKQLWPTIVVAYAAISTTFAGASAAVDNNCGAQPYSHPSHFAALWAGQTRINETRRDSGGPAARFWHFCHADITVANTHTPSHGATCGYDRGKLACPVTRRDSMGHAGGGFLWPVRKQLWPTSVVANVATSGCPVHGKGPLFCRRCVSSCGRQAWWRMRQFRPLFPAHQQLWTTTVARNGYRE